MIGQKNVNPWQGAGDQNQLHHYRNDIWLLQKSHAKSVMAPELLEFHKKKTQDDTNADAHDRIASFAAFFDDLSDALFPTSSSVKGMDQLEQKIEQEQAKVVVPIIYEPNTTPEILPSSSKHDSVLGEIKQSPLTDDQKQNYATKINESKWPSTNAGDHGNNNEQNIKSPVTQEQKQEQKQNQKNLKGKGKNATSSSKFKPLQTPIIIPPDTIQDINIKEENKKEIPNDLPAVNNQNHQSCDDGYEAIPYDSPDQDHSNNTGVKHENNGTPVVAPPISSSSIHSPSTVYYHDYDYHEVKKVKPEHRELDRIFVDGTRAISLVEDGLRTKIAVVDGEGKIKQNFNLDLTNQEAKHEVQQCLMDELATKYVFGYKIRQTLNLLGLSPGVAYDIQCFGSCDVNFAPEPGEFNHIIQAWLVMAYTKVRIIHQYDYKIPFGTFRKFGRFRLPTRPRNRHINLMETARVMRMALQIINHNENGPSDDGNNNTNENDQFLQQRTTSDQSGTGASDP